MVKLPIVVFVVIPPVLFPVIFSPKPTLVSELIPNEVVLAAMLGVAVLGTSGGQGTAVQVYALGLAVPALVVPPADGDAPVAKVWPICSWPGELTVIWFDPGVTRVAVTDTTGWMRVNVAFVGKVVLPLPKDPFKVTTFPAIDTIMSWVPVWNIPTPRPVGSATVMVLPLLERTVTVMLPPHT